MNKMKPTNEQIFKRQTMMYWLLFIVLLVVIIYGLMEYWKISIMVDNPCEACAEYAEKTNHKCIVTCYLPYKDLTGNQVEPNPLIIVNNTPKPLTGSINQK